MADVGDLSGENNMGKFLHSPAQMQGISSIKPALVVSSPFEKSKKKTEMKPDKTYQEKLKNRNPGALDQAEVLKGTLLQVKINNAEDLGLKKNQLWDRAEVNKQLEGDNQFEVILIDHPNQVTLMAQLNQGEAWEKYHQLIRFKQVAVLEAKHTCKEHPHNNMKEYPIPAMNTTLNNPATDT